MRVQPAKEAVGELSRQMADLLSQMAEGLAEAPDPKRAAEWLDRTRALRGEIERVDDALAQAEESVRLNPRRLSVGDPAAGLRDGIDTLERAATDMRVLARSVADSARIDSEHSPVKEAETRARLAASCWPSCPRRCGPTDSCSRPTRCRAELASFAAEPITEALEDHLEEAERQQDQLADLLSTNPAEQPDGWQLRGEILAHVDRLRSELEPSHLPEPAQVKPPLLTPPLKALHERRERLRSERHDSEWHRPAAADPPRRIARGGFGCGGFVGDRAAAAAEPGRRARAGQADRVPGAGQADRIGPLAARAATHRLPGEHPVLVVAEAGFVVGEEDLADEVNAWLRTPVLSKMFFMCCCTVCGETTSWSAIWLVEAPCKTSRVTSRSRGVSW